MYRTRAFGGGVIALTAGLIGTGSVIRSEYRAPARFLSKKEVREAFYELHGNDDYTVFDQAELPSLGEDGSCYGTVGNYRCWGIFDGHSGWSASNHVAKNILSYLNDAYEKRRPKSWLGELRVFQKGNNTTAHTDDNELPPNKFDEAINEAFTKLDQDMVQAPLAALKTGNAKKAAECLPVAVSGSCAMMAFYNPVSHLLKVALVGDSRALLGVQDAKGVWHSLNLTTDQTAENPDEVARIRREHPNDPEGIIRNGRILGYQPSRSFGDASTKYTKAQHKALANSFWMRSPHPLNLTPPYMIAQPVISTVTVDPKRPTFMVMGCDGLYEWLSNDEIVSLVGQWLEKHPVIPTKAFSGVKDQSSGYDSATVKRPQVLGWGPLETSVEDDNAATHLIRNALGGADFKKVSLLVSIPSPMSRRFRDDITCTVVFFNPDLNSKL